MSDPDSQAPATLKPQDRREHPTTDGGAVVMIKIKIKTKTKTKEEAQPRRAY